MSNYIAALFGHLKSTEIKPGHIGHVEIRHDGWCAHWRGRPCNCEPEIETGARVDKKYRGRK